MLRTSDVDQLSLPRTPPRPLATSPPPHHAREPLPQWRRFRFAPVLVSVFLCLAGVAVYIWPRLQVVRLAYRMQASEQRLNDLRQERDDLRRELAALRDPQRLYRVATEQLGMGVPGHDQVFVLTREPRGR
jgi:cell division protein FtsL